MLIKTASKIIMFDQNEWSFNEKSGISNTMDVMDEHGTGKGRYRTIHLSDQLWKALGLDDPKKQQEYTNYPRVILDCIVKPQTDYSTGKGKPDKWELQKLDIPDKPKA